MSPNTPPADERRALWRAPVIAGLMALAFVAVLWPKIATGTLWFHDELLSGNRAREMLLRHDPFTVTINFKPDFKKPPLQYWLEAALLLISKNRELAIRLPSLLYGALCLPATVFLAWTLTRRRQPPPDTWRLILPAVAVAAFGSFVHYSRIGLLDTGSAFYLALVLGGCQLARDNPRWWWLVGGACWLGAWQKAPYGFAAWVVVLAVRWLRPPQSTDETRARHLGGALALSLLLTAAWFGLQFLRHGDDIILDAGQEQANALLRGHDPDSAGFQPYLYWWWLVRDWALVGVLAPVAVVWTLARGWRDAGISPRVEVAAVCALYGLAVAITPFRVERYLTVMVPLLAVITLEWTARLLENFSLANGTRRALLGTLVALSFPVAAFHYLKPPRGGPDSLLAAAHALQRTLQPGETVVIDSHADPDFNTISFIVFYADLRARAKVTNVDNIQRLLQRRDGAIYRGIEHQDALFRLTDADPALQIVSRHGDWVLWRHNGSSLAAPARGGL